MSNKTYETAVNELEQILSQLENNNLPLEESIKQFESGVELIKFCQKILDDTEQKIKGLTEEKSSTGSNSFADNFVDNTPF